MLPDKCSIQNCRGQGVGSKRSPNSVHNHYPNRQIFSRRRVTTGSAQTLFKIFRIVIFHSWAISCVAHAYVISDTLSCWWYFINATKNHLDVIMLFFSNYVQKSSMIEPVTTVLHGWSLMSVFSSFQMFWWNQYDQISPLWHNGKKPFGHLEIVYLVFGKCYIALGKFLLCKWPILHK